MCNQSQKMFSCNVELSTKSALRILESSTSSESLSLYTGDPDVLFLLSVRSTAVCVVFGRKIVEVVHSVETITDHS